MWKSKTPKFFTSSIMMGPNRLALSKFIHLLEIGISPKNCDYNY